MDNQRVFLWAALALVLYFNYMAWQGDYAPKPVPAGNTTAQTQSANGGGGASRDTLPDLPSTTSSAPPAPSSGAAPAGSEAVHADAAVIRVVTDVLSLDISTRGGELIRADLLKYPVAKSRPDVKVRLFSPNPPLYVARSGLRAADQRAEPTHTATYQAAATEYKLEAGQKELVVPLTWTDGQGVTVTKTYTFHPGSYRINLNYDVANNSGSDYRAASYVQIVRHYEHVERSYFKVETYAYRGPAIYDGKAYRKLDVEDEEDRAFKSAITGGWMAALQHHFVAAAVPPTGATYDYQLNLDSDNDYVLSYRGPLETVPAGGTHSFKETLFVGPKLQAQLAPTGPKLERVADYGKLTIIAEPLFWLLEKVHSVVANWGVAIILVTFLIKLAFYKLTAASGRSMAKMRTLGPRIKALQDRYKDDQSARRVFAHPDPDSVLPGVLLGAAGKRGNAPGAVLRLDYRPVVARSVLHPADPDGRGDVCPVQAAADAEHRSDAGEDLRVHARDHVGDHGLVPGRPGALLVDQHPAVDRSAVAHQQAGRRGRAEKQELTSHDNPARRH
jgi:YidC/Oxa1 family membrane protein insertase